jgi:hypothetical protein
MKTENEKPGPTSVRKGGHWKTSAGALLLLCGAWAAWHYWHREPPNVPKLDRPSFTEALNKAFPSQPATPGQKIDEHLRFGPTLAEHISTLLATQPSPVPAPAAQEFSWEPLDVFFGQLFPSVGLARPTRGETLTAKEAGESMLGDYPNSPYSAKVISSAGKTIRLEIRCDELMEPSSSEVTIEKAGLWCVNVRVKWNFKALRQCTQLHPVHVTWMLSVDGKALPSQTRTVLVQPVDVMPLSYKSPSGTVIDCTHFFAAYANEDHPMLDAILREALDTEVVSRFTGMMSKDPKQVLDQVFAIWWALQKRGIVYSNIASPVTLPVAPANDRFNSQRVRFFDDVIQSRQANCIDGTLVLASLLRRIGLFPIICLTEDHAFLGFYLDGQQVAYIETTALGSRSVFDTALKNLVDSGADRHGLASPFDLFPRTRELAEEMFLLARGIAEMKARDAKAMRDTGKGYYYEIELEKERQFILPIPSEMRR